MSNLKISSSTTLDLLNKLCSIHYSDTYIEILRCTASTSMYIDYFEHADSEDFDVSKLRSIGAKGKRDICRIHTNKRQGYFFIKNNFKTFSIYHACNKSWSYNIPEDDNEYCYKCKIKTPEHIIIQQKVLNG